MKSRPLTGRRSTFVAKTDAQHLSECGGLTPLF